MDFNFDILLKLVLFMRKYLFLFSLSLPLAVFGNNDTYLEGNMGDDVIAFLAILLLIFFVIIFLVQLFEGKKKIKPATSVKTDITSDKTKPKVVYVQTIKSVGIAVFLAAVFGPVGLFYSSILGGVVMLVIYIITLIMLLSFEGDIIWLFILVVEWIVAMIWAYNAVSNERE